MKIAYKKRILNAMLFGGIAWLAWLLILFFINKELSWVDCGWFFISLGYLGTYFYQKQYKYIIIKDGVLKINGWFGKKVSLTEVKTIKRFAGDYILKTGEKELTINTQIIDADSLTELDMELKKLDVEWN